MCLQRAHAGGRGLAALFLKGCSNAFSGLVDAPHVQCFVGAASAGGGPGPSGFRWCSGGDLARAADTNPALSRGGGFSLRPPLPGRRLLLCSGDRLPRGGAPGQKEKPDDRGPSPYFPAGTDTCSSIAGPHAAHGPGGPARPDRPPDIDGPRPLRLDGAPHDGDRRYARNHRRLHAHQRRQFCPPLLPDAKPPGHHDPDHDDHLWFDAGSALRPLCQEHGGTGRLFGCGRMGAAAAGEPHRFGGRFPAG